MPKFHKITKDRVDVFLESEMDIETRTLWIGSSVSDAGEELGTEASMAERAIKGLLLLDSACHDPITILMNNIGGDEIHGMAIADAISLTQSNVVIKVFGHAMSMGSIILQAADKRLLAPHASVMVHYGTPLHVDNTLHALEQQMWARECEKFRVKMERLYLSAIREKHPGYELKDIKALLAFGTVLNAKEAVKLGLADGILKSKK